MAEAEDYLLLADKSGLIRLLPVENETKFDCQAPPQQENMGNSSAEGFFVHGSQLTRSAFISLTSSDN